jgi:4-hydroxythreonine-4-phosphate dehydrogenase
MGDPAGVGPEIILKALMHDKIYDACRPVVVGCKEILEYFIKKYNLQLKIHIIENVNDGFFEPGTIDLINMANIDIVNMKVGEIQASCGSAAYEYIVKSTQLAIEKKINAIATAPINKESLKAANIPFIGHTEILASLTNSYNPLTMFQVYNLRVFFLTRHLSLKKACAFVTQQNVYEFIIRCGQALNCLGMQNPRIAVAGLNPHSGEHGLFGNEEIKEIEPAIMQSRREGMNVIGPVPADSVFLMGLRGKYDAILSLYHDQGHIATKMVDFERTISITNNLPFLRTSVDHGTAFDIAGKGIASEVSMTEAIILAAQYANYFNV